ncbi:MAG TPA: BatA domain-containing protein, partial [Phycisphaerae bacterium]
MLFFAAPIWLTLAAAVGVFGAWGLWRGQRKTRRVSSLRLWRDMGQVSGESRRRAIDPLWVLVFFAAVMAALALAAPAWRMDTAPLVPTLDVEWSVRSLQTANGQHVEAWVHAPHAPGDITLVSNGSELKV